MPAGKYRHPITIQQFKAVPADGLGHVAETADAAWETFSTERASITPSGGREFGARETILAEVTHLVELRENDRTALITPKMRVRYSDGRRTRTLNIVRATNVGERNREIQLQCVEPA